DHPADLVDLLCAPLLRPEADRADAGAAGEVDDLEHAIAALEALVAALTLAQLVRALGAAGVLGHARVAHQPLQQPQGALAPGLERHRRAHSAQPSEASRSEAALTRSRRCCRTSSVGAARASTQRRG